MRRRLRLALVLVPLAVSSPHAQDALSSKQRIADLEHDLVAFPTTFFASLGFTLDIYDGRVLIDSVNRALLPVAQFPFGVGDELLSVDGSPVQTVISAFRTYAIAANERSTARITASRIVSRSQQIVVDYMTRTNLMAAGAPFVQAFTQAIVNHALAP